MTAIKFHRGWVNEVTAGVPFRMVKGDAMKDQTSRPKLRELGELYTVQQVAERLKVRALTVYDWVDKGKLKSVRLGRHIRIPETYLEDYLSDAPNKGQT